ncbi:hypothetical protein [Stigmatella erecta]|uniref:Uncharacterized protein n=1 Tax=Stigmatella erecta TaxID=83460 RepID=A0A1I0KG99_9BACT|nr:hypothetical protein [Stigmatella erecta]SEU22867.1 hypothetical protein SAMN05443639_110179 [Stigmatella erecta]
MPRLNFSPKNLTPSFSPPRTSPQVQPRPLQSPAPTTPRSPGRDTFDTRSPGPSTPQPRTSPPPADNDGWETVGPKKPTGPKTFDPDRRFNQNLTQIDNKLSSAAGGKGDMYGTVTVPKNDLARIHADLRERYHGKPVPGYPNERYYVTNQSFGRKAGGFNITSHEYNKNGVDLSRQDGRSSRFNIHILPP